MKLDITRAWKDETYRQSLNDEQLCMLPANPAGELELSEIDLASVCGQFGPGGSSGLGGGGDIHSFSIALCQNNVFSTNTITHTITGFVFGNITPICTDRS